MKTLYLLRHAKSSWDHPDLSDHDRPLNHRGRDAAKMIGSFLRDGGHAPDMVLCSTAIRTTQTLEIVLDQLGTDPATDLDADLYLAEPSYMLGRLRTLPETVESVLMVTHNPGTSMLADALCGDGHVRSLQQMRTKYPTAALAIIELQVDRWKETGTDSGHLVRFILPRDLD